MFSQKPDNIPFKISVILILTNTLNNQLQQVEGATGTNEVLYFYYLMNDGNSR